MFYKPDAKWGDVLKARQVAAPFTKALLGAGLVVLPVILVYLRLHRTIRFR